jgi:N,N'-diacetylbacillosaminyl-diphospho-undecaprenol alpha-1,3-N-acetylgalactosaminyltransferase
MKIALVNNDDFSMYHFRRGLIQRLVQMGIEVTVIVPPGRFNEKLEQLGVQCIPVPMERFVSPFRDIILFVRLWRIFKSERFDIMHSMTIKPNIYGTFAALLAGIKRRVGLISGTGFIFMDKVGWKTRLIKLPAMWMYKIAMMMSHKIWFQNSDDMECFVEKRILERQKGIVIRSGGINVDEYSPHSVREEELNSLRNELGLSPHSYCVLMLAARMVWSKGVREFIEAASMLHSRYPDWSFIMVCPKDKGTPDSVPDEYLASNRLERLIVIDAFRFDMKNFVAISDIMVLPSYYPEGVPRSLLEGLSMGKPIITTDHQGCRETVDNGKNGYLVPVKKGDKLAEKLTLLMSDRNLRLQFGQSSRYKAVSEFNEEIVVSKIIHELYDLPN